MSIRNQRTRRHEEDLADEAYRGDGDVNLRSLLEHAEEIIGETPEAFGTTTSRVVLRLCELVRSVAEDHPDIIDIEYSKVSLR